MGSSIAFRGGGEVPFAGTVLPRGAQGTRAVPRGQRERPR